MSKNSLSLQDALRLAHTVDIKVRVEGRDFWYEGDFLKEIYNLKEWVKRQLLTRLDEGE